MAAAAAYQKESSLKALRDVGQLWFKEEVAKKVVLNHAARVSELTEVNDDLNTTYHYHVKKRNTDPIRSKVHASNVKPKKAMKNLEKSEANLAMIRHDVAGAADRVSKLDWIQIITENDLQLLIKLKSKLHLKAW